MYNTEVLLESYLFPNGKAKLAYSALTEAEKVTFNKSMVTQLFNTMKNKTLKANYAGLEKVKGDITKYPKFSDIENSIMILQNMYKSNPTDSPNEIMSCVRVLDILKKNKSNFTNAYNAKNDAAEMLFVNVAASLIIGVSKLISITIDYIKQPNGSYKAMFKENSETLMKDDTYFLTLSRFITMDKNGQLKQIFNMSKNLKEDFNFLSEDDSSNWLKSAWQNGSKTVIVIGCFAVVIWACFSVPYVIYRMRKVLSDHLLNLAYFLEEHAYEVNTSTERGKKAQERQLYLVEKLKGLGNMLSLDEKEAKKQAEKDKDQDEEESRRSAKSDDTYNSDDDILL